MHYDAVCFPVFLTSELAEGKVHDPKEYYKERIEVRGTDEGEEESRMGGCNFILSAHYPPLILILSPS